MPSMNLDNGSFLGRNLRRFGKFDIALVALGAAALTFGVLYLITGLSLGIWFPKLCALAALGAAGGTYALFGRLDLIPHDPDKPLTLNLTERANKANAEPWVSGDRNSK